MKDNRTLLLTIGIVLVVGALFVGLDWMHNAKIRQMVYDHARAWETGDEELLAKLLHKDVVFAYPGRRLNKEQTLQDLRFFREAYENTKVYVNTIIVDGNNVSVEWQ